MDSVSPTNSAPSPVEERDNGSPVRHLQQGPSFDLHVFHNASTMNEGLDDEEGFGLPVFNKRPLTDTPIISYVGSPNPHGEHHISLGDTSPFFLSTQPPTKSLSDLNLTAMGMRVEPMSRPPGGSALSTAFSQEKLSTDSTPCIRSRTGTVSPRYSEVGISNKLVVVMVGLPARGKSYLTNKLTRYMNWLQHDTRVFNVGNTRRKAQPELGPFHEPLTDQNTGEIPDNAQHSAAFFSPDNADSFALREKWAMDTLDQLLDYLVEGPGHVGIFDATNTTKNRRLKLLRKIKERSGGQLKVLFLESVCTDSRIIETNMRLKLSGPDYRGMAPQKALQDFRGRLSNYERAYEAIDDEEEQRNLEFMYVKMIDVGRKIVAFNINGFLASQTIYYLLNFNLAERQIWVTRHGESEDNVSGRIGGDAPLTSRGQRFAKALTRFIDYQRNEFRRQQLDEFRKRLLLNFPPSLEPPETAEFYVWSSMLKRSSQTTQYFNETDNGEYVYSLNEMRILNELGAGECEGMTYKEIQKEFPQEFEARMRNKLTYRYPGVGGESYLDVINRVKPLINEIERTKNHVLLVTHRVVARVLLAYFLNLHKTMIGQLDVPLHSLYCLEAKPYGTEYYYYEYDEKQDWFYKIDPEHQKKTKQVGVAFQERRYSVVPTAPSSSLGVLRTAIGASHRGPHLPQPSEELNKLRNNGISSLGTLREKLEKLRVSEKEGTRPA